MMCCGILSRDNRVTISSSPPLSNVSPPFVHCPRLHAICPSKPAATRLRGTEGEDGGDRGNRRRKVVVADSDSSTTSESSSSSIGGGKE